jgi:hypothetical protein
MSREISATWDLDLGSSFPMWHNQFLADTHVAQQLLADTRGTISF